jgi:cysteine desulfurase
MKIFPNKTIYLDHAGATYLDPTILLHMNKAESALYANPSSLYVSGVAVRNTIDTAREDIAKQLFAHSDEIIFTGSGTESDALAIWGVVNNYQLQIANTDADAKKELPHIITCTIEHSAVLENCRLLQSRGLAEVTYIEPDAMGVISPNSIRDAIGPSTVLVSIMYANNEIGTIQPIQEIAKVIRSYRKTHESIYPYFHTDAAQAMNYLFTENVEKLGVDLMSFNSSKIYGPKGMGALYKKRSITLCPMYAGGGQEQGLRSGTENVAGIMGLSLALVKANLIKEKESSRLTKLRDYMIEHLLLLKDSGYDVILNGSAIDRLPNNINISISGISSELLVIELDALGIMVSAKSACKSSEPDASHVIGALRRAQGSTDDTHDGSLRITLGRKTTKEDIDTCVRAIKKILHKYKQWK